MYALFLPTCCSLYLRMPYAAHGQISYVQILFIIVHQDTSMRMNGNGVMFVQSLIFAQVIPIRKAYQLAIILRVH